MTNTSAITIFTITVLAMIFDGIFNGGEATLFLLRKFDDLREWLAFWR
ncbi:glyceraldehyde-3-phosphate dehydrogenase [Halocynthiibacter sp.]